MSNGLPQRIRNKKKASKIKSVETVHDTSSCDEGDEANSQARPIRHSQRQSIPTKRLCNEINVTLLEAEKANRNASSSDSDENVPLINCLTKNTKPKNNGDKLSDSETEVTEEQTTDAQRANAKNEVGSIAKTFPQSITQNLHNALVVNPSLHHLSQKAKEVLLLHLEEIEETYRQVLEVLPLKDVPLQLAEVTAPFVDPRIDAILDRLEDLDKKVTASQTREARASHPEVEPTGQTYAAALRAPKSTLRVRPTTDKSPKEILQAIKSLECPDAVRVTKLKVNNAAVEIRCDSERNKEKLSTYLHDKLADVAEIEDKRPALQRLLVFNVPPSVSEHQLLRSLGPDEDHLQHSRTLSTFAARREGCQNWVILCPKRLAIKILHSGVITAGFTKLRVKKHIRMHRCRNCQSINQHHTADCKADPFCPKCAGYHKLEECNSSKHKCINCHSRNRALKKDKSVDEADKEYLDTDHAADSPRCQTYQDFVYERICTE